MPRPPTGRLWVGTETGLDSLDRATGRFTHYRDTAGGAEATDGIVTAIVDDGAGGLWLGVYRRGLAHFDPATGAFQYREYVPGDVQPSGPSHLDTFDLKPDAPAEYRGTFNPIKTNVPGVEFCEHLPKLAQCADKFAILRGVSHTLAAHNLGTEYVNTGTRPLPSLQYPGYGAVVAKETEAVNPPDLPPFVAIPNGNQRPGFLGVKYAPLNRIAELAKLKTKEERLKGMPSPVGDLHKKQTNLIKAINEERRYLGVRGILEIREGR